MSLNQKSRKLSPIVTMKSRLSIGTPESDIFLVNAIKRGRSVSHAQQHRGLLEHDYEFK